MASDWQQYPKNYRETLVTRILTAIQSGDSAALLGLGGSGKSNLLGFMAAHHSHCLLVDCNRLPQRTADAFFRQVRRVLGDISPADDQFFALDLAVEQALARHERICLLLDRFDDLALAAGRAFFNNLRALRDAYKYRLTYVVATRHSLHTLRPLEDISEFVELLDTHMLYLGPLSASDCIWNVERYARRHHLTFERPVMDALIQLSGGYAALLRGALESWHNLADSQLPTDVNVLANTLLADSALSRRLSELWDDLSQSQQLLLLQGTPDDELHQFGLMHADGQLIPLLAAWLNLAEHVDESGLHFDIHTGQLTRDQIPLEVKLTPKESALLAHLQAQAGQVCTKDDIIRAVWPEDAVYEKGIRDDSLAQLVRRLREKVEPDASQPVYILTIPGRGYQLAQPGDGSQV